VRQRRRRTTGAPPASGAVHQRLALEPNDDTVVFDRPQLTVRRGLEASEVLLPAVGSWRERARTAGLDEAAPQWGQGAGEESGLLASMKARQAPEQPAYGRRSWHGRAPGGAGRRHRRAAPEISRLTEPALGRGQASRQPSRLPRHERAGITADPGRPAGPGS
ncbi:MAG: hypothetical protein PVG27_08435, partial [Chloroflexota bacterium]